MEGEVRGNEKVFVAVGRSPEKVVALLQWTLVKFGGCELCLAHVHQPSPTIPYPLGNLPAAQANARMVAAYRKEERGKTRKLLDSYLRLCRKRKINASIVTSEAEQIQVGLVDMIEKHCIRKLVIGALPRNCISVKNSSGKATYTAKNAPPFCEIWFVRKGKDIWTRQALEGFSPNALGCHSNVRREESLRSKSLRFDQIESLCHDDHVRFSSSNICTSVTKELIQGTRVQIEDVLVSSQPLCRSAGQIDAYTAYNSAHATTSRGIGYTSPAERQISSDSDSMADEEILYGQFAKADLQVEKSNQEALMDLPKRKKMEADAIYAISKVKDFEAAQALEAELRKDAEDAIKATVHERDRIFEQRLEVTKELQKVRTNVTVLSSRVQEVDCRRNETAKELTFIQESIASLKQEKHNLQKQTMEADCWLANWRSNRVQRLASQSEYSGSVNNAPGLEEFSLLDVQTATCNFSSSFKLGEGGYGCVYKGELSGKTVAIKQMHVRNMQGPSQFQKEVQVIGKIRHPHLINLIGACPEGWALVYDYLGSGSLHNRLFNRSNVPFTWKDRTRIISEISCALLFLHSLYPEKIVHGNLKPENILLDSEMRCKLCDFGICRLVTEETLRCPSLRRCAEPRSAFPYTDPEFCRTGVLTPKSDVYSFGMVILQLLTGRPPGGLLVDVRKALSRGRLASILDPSAGAWPTYVVGKLVNMGLEFCKSTSHERPPLTPSLVRELQKLHNPEERQMPSYFICPIVKEIMLDPVVAADGSTYEREALCKWLENGRETSPMTNLPLIHLHLTPDHTLRRAIQDWLCKS